MANCEWCHGQGDESGLIARWGYDWDSDDDDATSVTRVLGRRCANRTHCARRIVEQGNDPAALQMVAADQEHLGDLAIQARAQLTSWQQVYQDIALADEAAARENGYGAIGGGVWL